MHFFVILNTSPLVRQLRKTDAKLCRAGLCNLGPRHPLRAIASQQQMILVTPGTVMFSSAMSRQLEQGSGVPKGKSVCVFSRRCRAGKIRCESDYPGRGADEPPGPSTASNYPGSPKRPGRCGECTISRPGGRPATEGCRRQAVSGLPGTALEGREGIVDSAAGRPGDPGDPAWQ